MAEEGKMITYDYHRLTGISYTDHPENNVKYYYGVRNASYNRIGRLMMCNGIRMRTTKNIACIYYLSDDVVSCIALDRNL